MEPSVRYALTVALFYGICSASMNFFNKILLNTWSFKFPNFIMFVQLLFTAIFIKCAKMKGYLSWVEDYSISNAKKCLPVSLIFCVNTVLALLALGGMNIPMYNALRRCGPIAILMLSPCFIRQETNRNIIFSVVMITFGTFLAGWGDLEFDFTAYAFGIVSVFTQALYFLVVQKLGVDKDFNALSIVYINSVSCTPLMLFFTFLYGESPGINTFEDIANPVFWINFISVVSFACIFSYSIFLSTTVNSALSTALVGVIKSALTTIIGMYTFGGVTATTSFVLGQMVNLGGGALYTYEKYQMKTAQAARREYLNNSSEPEKVKLVQA